ncbi:MAG: dipeptide epimerase [Verrucomicrobiae bacterium]|nr:dipeptide epimerase [Verrucomicrobiae bacterium]
MNRLEYWTHPLALRHRWTIATSVEQGGRTHSENVFLRLHLGDGPCGQGEAPPLMRYGQNTEDIVTWLRRLPLRELDGKDPSGTLARLPALMPPCSSALCALDTALHDLAATRAGKPLYSSLDLPAPRPQPTSFSIGITDPAALPAKLGEAREYSILKVKLGGPHDRQTLEEIRRTLPRSLLRVDANEAWKNAREALAHIGWLADLGGVEFVEQPMPRHVAPEQWRRLFARSPLPLYADESIQTPGDISTCAAVFHGINVKLSKCGGIQPALALIRAARSHGLKIMLGCMIESSLLSTAAFHLSSLADHLDLDGPLLISNDPYRGLACRAGVLSLADPASPGLGVRHEGG